MTQRRSQRSSQSSKRYGDSGSDIEMEDSGDETRCICGRAELQLPKKADKNEVDTGLFIQCDSCHAWQHGYCVGFLKEEDVPDVYYCERCRPDLHVLVVRPSGKASSYIPHLKKIGKYNPKKRSRTSDTEIIKDEPQEADDESKNDNRSSSSSNGSSTAVMPSPKKENKDFSISTREQRRRTQNSTRQLEYEETLRRVLEESVHDAPIASKDNASDADSSDETAERTDNLQVNNDINNQSDKSDNQAADSADNSSTTDSANGFKRKTLRSSSRQSAKEETSHDDISIQEQENSSSSSKTVSVNNKKKVKSGTSSRSKSASKPRKSPGKTQSQSASSLIKSQSKPRIPQARSTVAEMQKRVAAILEFIGRTQVDMADEREEMLKLLSSRSEKFSNSSKSLQEERFTKILDSSASFQSMEVLTNKLLRWEETFGRYREC